MCKITRQGLLSGIVVTLVTATLEFGHKVWLLRLETLQTFDQSDVYTKRKRKKRKNSQSLEDTVWIPNFGKTQFGKIQFGKIQFGKIQFGTIQFGKIQVGKYSLEKYTDTVEI